MYICEAEIAAGVHGSEAFVVQTEKVQDGRVEACTWTGSSATLMPEFVRGP